MTKQEKINLEYRNIEGVNLHPREDSGYAVISDWSNTKSKFNRDMVNISTEYCTDIFPDDSTRKVLIPKALVGIGNNNGWNQIEEKGLPNPEETVIWLRDEGEPPVIASMLDTDFYGEDYFTHWRPFDFKQPLY